MSVEIVGPFTEHRVVIDGYVVPGVTCHPTSDGQWNVVVGGHAVLCSQEEAERWLPLLAHARADAQGYSTHGENSARYNPHKVRMTCIGSVETDGPPFVPPPFVPLTTLRLVNPAGLPCSICDRPLPDDSNTMICPDCEDEGRG